MSALPAYLADRCYDMQGPRGVNKKKGDADLDVPERRQIQHDPKLKRKYTRRGQPVFKVRTETTATTITSTATYNSTPTSLSHLQQPITPLPLLPQQQLPQQLPHQELSSQEQPLQFSLQQQPAPHCSFDVIPPSTTEEILPMSVAFESLQYVLLRVSTILGNFFHLSLTFFFCY